jgi:nicotinate phosphoribosyltransferase
MSAALLCDLYELTMAQIYFNENRHEKAVFNFFVRPNEKRNYYLFAGLQKLLEYLENLTFDDQDIDYLRSLGKFDESFLNYLRNFRFRGDVWALQEGEFFFANEPVVQIEASLIEAQIVETALINILQIAILTATKAMRCKSVAKETTLVDFGARRAQGFDAAVAAARSSYIAGFLGTSNLEAGRLYGIPVFGTMAHSFILAHTSEEEAFEAFAKTYPESSVFLVDTFDTIEGVKKAIAVAKKMGLRLKGVRLDSGNIATLAKECRKLLDEAGLKETQIFVSGGINEYKIKELLEEGTPVDAWGVGTELVVSADMPYLDCAYKLVELDGVPKMKKSSGKVTLPGKKQLYRFYEHGVVERDLVALFDEEVEGEAMLHKVMSGGEVTKELPTLKEVRLRCAENFHKLPSNVRALDGRSVNVELSEGLKRLLETMIS